MTEDEAKGKWCPFVRFVSSTIGEHDCFPNRPVAAGVADVTMCLGSACMAWRWSESEEGPLKRATSADTAIAVLGTPEHRSANRTALMATRQGLCGLAGS